MDHKPAIKITVPSDVKPERVAAIVSDELLRLRGFERPAVDRVGPHSPQ